MPFLTVSTNSGKLEMNRGHCYASMTDANSTNEEQEQEHEQEHENQITSNKHWPVRFGARGLDNGAWGGTS